MNCYNHPETTSVATCIDCGKGLCKECASIYALPICNQCNAARVSNDKNIIKGKYIPSILCAILGVFFGLLASSNIPWGISKIIVMLFCAYLFAGIPWGWFVISFITPKMFVFMSWFGWAMYFVIKASLSLFVGIIAMPVGVIRLILKYKDACKKENYINKN